MQYFKKICALVLSLSLLLGLVPGAGVSAKESEKQSAFDAYRKPFLSGPVQTWIYQGEEYGNNRNKVFADDQEDGDLTSKIKQTGTVNTSKPGNYPVTYQVTDSDGNTAEMKTNVTVLATGSTDASSKRVQRKLYTLPDASHLTEIGFNRGYFHDRQSLGIWLPAGGELKIRLVNSGEFGKELELKLLNDDSVTEKLSVETSGAWGTPKDSAKIPANGDWITVKNSFQDGEELKSADSVPFIYTPKNTTVQPIVEIEWNDGLNEIPYYRYKDNERAFFAEWDRSKAPFAIIEGQAATYLVPVIDRNKIINYPDPNVKEAYRFKTIDEMLGWAADFVTQYDAYSGLSFDAEEPYNQNVRAKFFIKANQHGAGLAYYSSDHSASNDKSLGSYLYREWVSLHEFGHGYEGAIATRENSFVETTNNIMGHYFESTYRLEEDFGWLLDVAGATKLERYNNLGSSAERLRNEVTSFNDMTEGRKEYRSTLYMFINMLDCLGPQETVSAMHTQYRRYVYENQKHTSSSDVIIDSFSRTGGYNVAPYFDGWHINASEVVEDKLYGLDLPMVYYLRNLIPDDALAEQARRQLNDAGAGLNGIYSLVSTDDLAKLSTKYTSDVTLNISIDDFAAIEGRTILIKNGSKIAARVTADQPQLKVSLPVGIYEVELPLPRTAEYSYGNEYLVAAKGNVTKELVYKKASPNPLVDDTQLKLFGMSDAEVAVFTLDTENNLLNCRINSIQPHYYFTDPQNPYITVRIMDAQGKELFRASLQGDKKAEAVLRDFAFPVGAKVEIMHREPDRMRFVSRYTREPILAYEGYKSNSVTFVRTQKGLMPDTWNESQVNGVYAAMLNEYSDFVLKNMSREDLALEEKFHNAKMVLSKAYECLDEEGKQEYRAVYGMLIGEEPDAYHRYEKIDSSLLRGEAKSQQDQNNNAAANAVDGDVNTIWHSAYNEKDILAGDKNTYTITLPANTDIGKLEYLPRQDGENGIIRSFAISYSTTASGEDFTNIPLSSNTWEADKALKGIEFYAPDARRIRITALSTAGDGNGDQYISAAEFYLYERYDAVVKKTYLSDLYLDTADKSVKKYHAEDPASLVVNGTEKSFDNGIGMNAGSSVTWDLEGKPFDALSARIGVAAALSKGDKASAKIYGDGVLLYETEILAGKDASESVYLKLAGIRNLTVSVSPVSGSAHVILADAKLLNQDNQKEMTMIEGERVAVAANMDMTPPNKGKISWSSSDPSVAEVYDGGTVNAVREGEAKITARYSDGSSFECSVHVKKPQNHSLADSKANALAVLMAYKNLADYRDAQKKELEAIIAQAQAAIENAADEAGIAQAVEAAKAAMDKIKTNAQFTEEEKGSQTLPKVGTKKTVGDITYQITAFSPSKKTAAVFTAKKKAKIVIPATVNIDGYQYQVNEIKTKAFRNNKKITQVTIGNKITRIGKKAFEGCKNLKKITIKSKKITKIEKNAFAKISSKAKITVPKGKLKSYKKLFQNAKLPKGVRIK